MNPRVVLVGTPGAGKTTVGQLLADEWQVGFRDTDADIEALTSKSVADIFIEDGEELFRELEIEAVARALAEHEGVLALGGGAVLAAPTRELLAAQPVVWLRVGLADAVNRVGLSGARPLLVGNVRGRMHALMQERAPLYESVARLIVDTDGRSPEAVAAAVVAGLGVSG